MLRSLSIRNFVVVEALDVEFDAGFTVLTGETGAGKSILLDALGLILGDRFEQRQLRPGAERAELAAAFDVDAVGSARQWLAGEQLDSGGELLLRRVQDAQGRSRDHRAEADHAADREIDAAAQKHDRLSGRGEEEGQ